MQIDRTSYRNQIQVSKILLGILLRMEREWLGEWSLGEALRPETCGTYIFIASNCSFLGIISSMCGASKGYVVTTCVLMARWTEDLTLDFEPGEMLPVHISRRALHKIDKEIYSFLNILNGNWGVAGEGECCAVSFFDDGTC
jgi:hypothetical protein